jgi:hypothetical protein
MQIFYYVYIWLVYNVLDVITTHIGFKVGLVEGNQIPALVVAATSENFLPVYKLTAALLWLGLVFFVARRWPKAWLALRIANILVFGAVFWNILLIGSSLR